MLGRIAPHGAVGVAYQQPGHDDNDEAEQRHGDGLRAACSPCASVSQVAGRVPLSFSSQQNLGRRSVGCVHLEADGNLGVGWSVAASRAPTVDARSESSAVARCDADSASAIAARCQPPQKAAEERGARTNSTRFHSIRFDSI